MAKGKALEAEGLAVLRRMGLDAIGSLKQVQLRHLDPHGPHAAGEHTEFDYHYRFLLANRTHPTSVAEIEAAVLQERASREARAARRS